MTDDGKSCAAIRAELAEARSDLLLALDQRNTAWKQRDRFMGERDDARRKRDEAVKERDALRAELDALKAKLVMLEPAKATTDTRPVVKVGQVWEHRHYGLGRCIAVGNVARFDGGIPFEMLLRADGTPVHIDEWHLVTDAPEPVKVEPFKLRTSYSESYWGQLETELTTMRERLAKLEAGK